MRTFFREKHTWVIPIYFLFYLTAFRLLELRGSRGIHLIHTELDDRIPFCEYFIVPYFLWFVYVAAAVAYFALAENNVREYWRFMITLAAGMTMFLLVSWVFPNGHQLRPQTLENENIFTQLVEGLYRMYTSTNIFPSIHVFNSLAVAAAVDRCTSLKKYRILRKVSWILAISIILSTMFLKQHSAVDVLGGIALYLILWKMVYGRKPRRTAAGVKVIRRLS